MNNNIIEKQFLNSKPLEATKPTKEDLQIKKLQLQIEALEQKKNIQQQKAKEQQKTSVLKTISDLVKGLLGIAIILLSPLVIIGGFLLACAKASGGTGRGRRY